MMGQRSVECRSDHTELKLTGALTAQSWASHLTIPLKYKVHQLQVIGQFSYDSD